MIEPFLTAYDPSDLPGGSVDPLGFDRGYSMLADKLLPGLTNVANRPRYFSVLCAGIAISDERAGSSNESPRECRARRLEAVLRTERFWTLACTLASRKDPALDVAGVRGIRYVQRALARLDERGDTSTEADFPLLSRQMPYGLIGIYGSVGDELGMIDRASLTLGPDIGRRLALSFVAETEIRLRRHQPRNDGYGAACPDVAAHQRVHDRIDRGGAKQQEDDCDICRHAAPKCGSGWQ